MNSIFLQVLFALRKNLIFTKEIYIPAICTLATLEGWYLQTRREHCSNLKWERRGIVIRICWGRIGRSTDTYSIGRSNYHLHRLTYSIYIFDGGVADWEGVPNQGSHLWILPSLWSVRCAHCLVDLRIIFQDHDSSNYN